LAAECEGFSGGGVGCGKAGDVRAGGEGFFSGAGEENDADGGVFGEEGEDVLKVIEELGVESVEDGGAVEGYGGDGACWLVVYGVFIGEEEGFVGGDGDAGFDAGFAHGEDDTIEGMIKGMTVVERIGERTEYARLTGLLSSLGFEAGKGWKDGEGEGAAFLSPVGNLELVSGRMPAVPRILVEVTQLDHVHAAVVSWFGGERAGVSTNLAAGASPIEMTHWNSRMFVARLSAELEVGFWQSEDPMHGVEPAIEGGMSAEGMRFAVVTTRWNTVITDRLLRGALDCLRRSGAKREEVQVVRVPGAWEIPNAARTLAESGCVDAVITLGCLLRGETAHYEAIYTEVARGIGQSQQETGVPHAFGVLTCETLEQALDRAGLKAGNKGFEAASAAIEMVSVQRQLKGGK